MTNERNSFSNTPSVHGHQSSSESLNARKKEKKKKKNNRSASLFSWHSSHASHKLFLLVFSLIFPDFDAASLIFACHILLRWDPRFLCFFSSSYLFVSSLHLQANKRVEHGTQQSECFLFNTNISWTHVESKMYNSSFHHPNSVFFKYVLSSYK